jgi:hypothetical protein
VARALRAGVPRGLVLTELHDIKVQRGIRLTRFERGGETFRASCREIANGSGARLALELRASDGTLHYSALAEMAETPPRAPQATHPQPLAPAPWPVERLYGELLFHGESFRVIRSLQGADERGAAAQLAGVSEMGWRMAPWLLDAAAIDGRSSSRSSWGSARWARPRCPRASRGCAFMRTAPRPWGCSAASRPRK